MRQKERTFQSKKDSYKNQGKGAVELARSIYPESSSKGVVSTLCYGVEWDAAIKFLSDVQNTTITPNKLYIENSINMGWHSDNYSSNESHRTGIDIGTNAANKIKNIYDMAGNVAEWTMEAYGTKARFYRSGDYLSDGSKVPASARNADGRADVAMYYHGFRIALYIK